MSLLTLCYHLYSTCGLHGKFIGDEILRMQAHYNLYNYFILLRYIAFVLSFNSATSGSM